MSQNDDIAITTADGLKRFAAVAHKVYFRVQVGQHAMTLPVEKGEFKTNIKPMKADDTVDALFTNGDLVVTL